MVHYIVRDEKGVVVKGEELKSVHQQLPETIGNADTGDPMEKGAGQKQ